MMVLSLLGYVFKETAQQQMERFMLFERYPRKLYRAQACLHFLHGRSRVSIGNLRSREFCIGLAPVLTAISRLEYRPKSVLYTLMKHCGFDVRCPSGKFKEEYPPKKKDPEGYKKRYRVEMARVVAIARKSGQGIINFEGIRTGLTEHIKMILDHQIEPSDENGWIIDEDVDEED